MLFRASANYPFIFVHGEVSKNKKKKIKTQISILLSIGLDSLAQVTFA